MVAIENENGKPIFENDLMQAVRADMLAEGFTDDEITQMARNAKAIPIAAPKPTYQPFHATGLLATKDEFCRRVQEHYGDPLATIERGGKVRGRCPAHDDHKPSMGLSMTEDKILVKCLAGCSFKQIVESVGMKEWQFFAGLSLEELAEEKKLPVEQLISWGVSDSKDEGHHGQVKIEYRCGLNGVTCTRYRRRPKDGESRFLVKSGNELAIYGEHKGDGVDLLPPRKESVVFVEGESDSWTLWHQGVACYGIPGATVANVVQKEHLAGIARVYIWKEHGSSGETFEGRMLKRLKTLDFTGDIFIIRHDQYDDPSEIHCAGVWDTVWPEVMTSALPITPDVMAVKVATVAPDEPKSKRRFNECADEIGEAMSAEGAFPLATGGRFFIYCGTHYRAQEEIARLVRSYFKRWGWTQSNNVIGNVTPIIESYCWLDKNVVGSMPFWKGGSPPFTEVRNLVTYRNGLLDLATGVLHPHSPNWCSTYCLPYNYDPAAACPTWERFLGDVYEDDASRIELLQEYAGYVLSQDTSHQKALVLVGKPRSGKGTIQRTFERVAGKENSTGFALERLATEFGLSALLDKTLATVPEVELAGSKDRPKIIESWKSIIGEDSMNINIKHNPQMNSVRLPTRFLVAANAVPRLMDASGALLARLMFIPHEISFTGREDRELDGKLQQELPGIANWALAGLRRLRANGKFTLAEGHTRLSTEFATDTTPVLQWVRDCVKVSRCCDPGDLQCELSKERLTGTKKHLYASYETWCEDHDVLACNMAYWSRDLQRLIPKLKTEQPRANGQLRQFVGCALKVEATAEQEVENVIHRN